MPDLNYLTRREWLRLSGLATIGAIVGACAPGTVPSQLPFAAAPSPQFGDAQRQEAAVASPAAALQRLQDGNARYVANAITGPNRSSDRRTDVAKEQHPWAAIWGCIDSRVPPELIFDRGLGDLFVIRTAGQVIDNASLGSLEFAVEEGVKVVMVLGHSSCGAVKSTITTIDKNGHAEGKIETLVQAIKPAYEQVKREPGDKVANTVRKNVMLEIEKLKSSSEFIKEAVDKGTILLVGAIYDLEKGTVVQITTG